MTRITRRLLPLFPLAALWLLGRMVPAPPAPPLHITASPAPGKAGRVMANPQVVIGGPAVNVPVTYLNSDYDMPSEDDPHVWGITKVPPPGAPYALIDTGDMPVVAGDTEYGQNGPFAVVGSNTFTTVGGGSYQILSVKALSNIPVGTDYILEEYNNSTGSASGRFDVVAASGGGGGGGGGGAVKTVWGLYDLEGAGHRMLVSAVSFTVKWSDALALTLEYSRDGSMASDAAYAAATWTPIPVTPAPPDHGGAVSAQTWNITLPYFLDAALIRLRCVGSGGSGGSVTLTDFRLSPAPAVPNLWSPGDTGRFYAAPMLVDGAVNDGATGYDGA